MVAIDRLAIPGPSSRNSRLWFLDRSYGYEKKLPIPSGRQVLGDIVLNADRFARSVGGKVVLYESERELAGIGIEVPFSHVGCTNIEDFLAVTSTRLGVNERTKSVLVTLPSRRHLGGDG